MYPNALGNGLTPEQAVSLRSSDDNCDMGAEDRCGYVVRPADAELDSAYGDLDDEWWYERGGFVCCWREPWRGTGRCVWHADVEDKPVEALRRSRKPVAERLDGARLVGVTAGDELSFARCDLLGVDFSDADLSGARIDGHTDFGRVFAYEDRDEVSDWDATPERAAVRTYHSLERLFERQGLADEARNYREAARRVRRE